MLRIRDLGSGAPCIRDPGWVKSQDPDPVSRTNNPDHIFFGLKYFDSLMRIRDPGWKQFGSGIRDGNNSDLGSGMEKNRFRDKHPGSATLYFSHVPVNV